jgi:hypothetical protein
VTVAAKKREVMHDCWHLAYASVSAAEPSPWTHLAAQAVVSLAMALFGQGTLKHFAEQQISLLAPV